jgi:hypothetical protein
MAITAPAPGVRTCRHCGQTKPAPEFVKGLNTCRTCRSAHRRADFERRRAAGDPLTSSTQRQKRAELRQRLGWREVEEAPDPAPARLLGELLRYDRDYGIDFTTAWTEDVQFVLDRVRGPRKTQERESWALAFQATRAAWESAWSGEAAGPGSSLSPALLAALSGERERHDQLG